MSSAGRKLPGLLIAMASVALVAAAIRVPLLWDDVWPPGYDGWYYVLQVRSTLAGQPLFADDSLVYPLLAAIGWVLGDVIVGNKVAVCVFAAIGAAGATVGGARWTGSVAAGLVVGVWWAAAPGHLFLSTEFLKNEAGCAVLGLILALLPGCERRWPQWLSVVLLALAGVWVHKLTGLFGGVLVVGYGSMRAARGRLSPWIVLGGVVLLVVGVAAFGVLRPVDLQRFLPDSGAVWGKRWELIASSPRLSLTHRAMLVLAHVSPLLLGLGLVGKGGRELRDLGVPLVLLAGLTTALFLPFGFDLTSWRLLLLAFVPGGFLGALVVARTHIAVAAVPLLGLSLPLFWTVPHQTRPEPDYQAWSQVIPVLQAHIPAGDRVVAHRGLCGFVYGAADRPCENFDPVGPAEGWWRIVYGQAVDDLSPYSDLAPVRLRPAYVLIPESAWRAYRAAHRGDNPYIEHPMNPYRPRPPFAYGPRVESKEKRQ